MITGVDPAVQAAKSLKENAKRLGMEWTIRPGTVASQGPVVTVHLDGPDTDTTHQVISMLDSIPVQGSRVMVLILPDTMYIVGRIGSTARGLTNLSGAHASADLTLTTTATLVPGATVTVTVTSPAKWKVGGVFDFDMTSAASTVAVGQLFLDGVAQTEQALFEMALATDRATVGQQWTNTFTSAGTKVFELRASKSVNVGTVVAKSPHTSIIVETFE